MYEIWLENQVRISPFLDYGHVVAKCFLEISLVSKLTVAQLGINFPPFMHPGSSKYLATEPVMLQYTFLTFTTYFRIRSVHIFFFSILSFTRCPSALYAPLFTFLIFPFLLSVLPISGRSI